MEVLRAGSAGIGRAVELLRGGAVVGVPTDTVYGLAAVASNTEAVARIYAIKNRPEDKRLILFVRNVEMAEAWVEVDAPARLVIERWWPGALTVVMRTRAGRGEVTTAVRIPDHPVAMDLLQALAEPLATTSANRGGEPPALTASEVFSLAGVAAIIDDGPSPGGLPSTLLDLTEARPRILRPGPITEDQLRSVL